MQNGNPLRNRQRGLEHAPTPTQTTTGRGGEGGGEGGTEEGGVGRRKLSDLTSVKSNLSTFDDFNVTKATDSPVDVKLSLVDEFENEADGWESLSELESGDRTEMIFDNNILAGPDSDEGSEMTASGGSLGDSEGGYGEALDEDIEVLLLQLTKGGKEGEGGGEEEEGGFLSGGGGGEGGEERGGGAGEGGGEGGEERGAGAGEGGGEGGEERGGGAGGGVRDGDGGKRDENLGSGKEITSHSLKETNKKEKRNGTNRDPVLTPSANLSGLTSLRDSAELALKEHRDKYRTMERSDRGAHTSLTNERGSGRKDRGRGSVDGGQPGNGERGRRLMHSTSELFGTEMRSSGSAGFCQEERKTYALISPRLKCDTGEERTVDGVRGDGKSEEEEGQGQGDAREGDDGSGSQSVRQKIRKTFSLVGFSSGKSEQRTEEIFSNDISVLEPYEIDR